MTNPTEDPADEDWAALILPWQDVVRAAGYTPTPHDHLVITEGCFRCELNKDEMGIAPTLTGFYLARLAEDEAMARAVGNPYWQAEENRLDEGWWMVASEVGSLAHSVERPEAEHIARHDPARVLAEVEAKRELADAWADSEQRSPWGGYLRVLAAVYADHPDYREEWRP